MNSDTPSSSSASSPSLPPSHRSSQSLSPSPSPSLLSSSLRPASLTLVTLTQHFLAAKHALTFTTQHMSRANTLVTHSRAIVEELAILHAKAGFVERDVEEEVAVLEAVKERLRGEGETTENGFQGTIDRLDRANGRLEGTLVGLRGRLIKEDGQAVHPGQIRTLYDFIDPSTHETLQAELRKDIDDFTQSRSEDFGNALTRFSDSLDTIESTLSEAGQPSASLPPKTPKSLYQDDDDDEEGTAPSTIKGLFQGQETHAAETATLLHGLVRHYDLCVNALKHTEGGGEAAKQAIQQADGSGTLMDESLYRKAAPEPISETDRVEMLSVLAHDALELDDVVDEISVRCSAQEDLASQLLTCVQQARRRDAVLREVVTMLHEMHTLHLPSFMHSLSSFKNTWFRIRQSISQKTDGLVELADGNEAFLTAYGKLGEELERRRQAEARMDGIKRKAEREVQRMQEADRDAREKFLEEYGGSLPRGIWDGG
ncbi:Autophagy-related protein 17 [Vermiconidia calcicola]|uniref:Autophagy-related protein 17 n=1 Tax=Vermiconidia calcicola TaxID=1690605 RepID=A0ACC3MB39_9PEZI|nr:Autophagy-related protein 17 [Vermiconidia calcicola]